MLCIGCESKIRVPTLNELAITGAERPRAEEEMIQY